MGKASTDNLSYFYVMAGQLAEMAQTQNLPVLAHLFFMAQQEAAELGVQRKPERKRLDS